MPNLRTTLRVFLAAVLLVAGGAKAVDAKSTRISLATFGVPIRLTGIGTGLLVFGEAAAGLLLFYKSTSRWGLRMSIALLSLFSTVLSWHLIRGNRPQCRCFGRFSSAIIGWPSVARNIGLISISSFLLVTEKPVKMKLELKSVAVIGVTLFTVQTLAFFAGVAIILRRIELLLSDHHQFSRENGTDSEEIQKGEIVEDISLTDSSGSPNSLYKVSKDRPISIFVMSTSCAPCQTVLKDLNELGARLDERGFPAILVLPVDDKNPAKVKSDYGIEVPVFQGDYRLYRQLRVQGTPSMLLMDSTKLLVTDLISGDNAILSFLERQ